MNFCYEQNKSRQTNDKALRRIIKKKNASKLQVMENITVSYPKICERESSSAPFEENCNQSVVLRKQGIKTRI